MAVYEIEILNWEKYNPRNDQKKRTWFRMDADVFDDPVIDLLPPTGLKFWLWLLCRRTKQTPSTVVVDTDHARRRTRLRTEYIQSTIRVLTEYGRVTSKLRPSTTNDSLSPKALQPESGQIRALRTNERDVRTNVTDVPYGGDPKTPKVVVPKKAPNPVAQEIALKNRAAAIVDQMMGTLLNPDADKSALSSIAVTVVKNRFVDWERFHKEASYAYKSGKELFFISQLKDSVLAALLLSVDAQREAK